MESGTDSLEELWSHLTPQKKMIKFCFVQDNSKDWTAELVKFGV